MPSSSAGNVGAEEASAVGVCSALKPEDYMTSTHRGHGHCIGKGAEAGRMLAEFFGREDGYCRGRGGSMHLRWGDAGNLGHGPDRPAGERECAGRSVLYLRED